MSRWRITFDQDLPDDVTGEQVREWARFFSGENGAISEKNPLHSTEFEAAYLSVETERTS